MLFFFFRHNHTSIDRYSWVNDVELEDLENYQARRQPVCVKCGRVRPLPGQIISNQESQEQGNLLPTPEQEIAGQLLAEQLAERAMSDSPGGLENLPVSAEPPEPP